MKIWIWLFFLGMTPFLSHGAVVSISSTDDAFAALTDGGAVVVWGDSVKGGSLAVASYNEINEEWVYSALTSSLLSSGVDKVFSNGGAFAALKDDGAVVTWGHSDFGGDSSNASGDLTSGVKEIVGTIPSYWDKGAFAAIKNDGSVVVWGDQTYGGRLAIVSLDHITLGYNFEDLDSSLLSGGVSKIVASKNSFAALKDDGSVVTWGFDKSGGRKAIYRDHARTRIVDISLFLESGVTDIFSNNYAFAALKDDGSLVVWGNGNYGGDATWLESELGGLGSTSRVSAVFSTRMAFAALRADGRVITWGKSSSEAGDSSSVSGELAGGISTMVASNTAFAALNSSGGLVTWGYHDSHGDIYLHDNPVTSGVSRIFANFSAFAALKTDGSVVSWGWGVDANTTIGAEELASGVTDIVGSPRGHQFAALKSDGSVITWGFQTKITTFGSGSNISKIFANKSAFVALKNDGTLVAWGNANTGGSLSGVSGL